MGAGGPPHAQLAALCERYAISLHGVALSIGSPGGAAKLGPIGVDTPLVAANAPQA